MRYLTVALVVSLAWLHQDWLIWPLLSEVQKEHDLILGIPAGLGYQVALSFATAAVWFLAVWKAWPTELETWASAGENRRGGRNRGDNRRGGRDRSNRGDYRPSDNRGERTERSSDSSSESRSRRRRGGRGRRSGSSQSGQSNPNSPNNLS
ncbi:MAG: hypothetical protein H8E27_02115 [Verrucomicrobia subdivision 3 bacterium]|nr:hypothetical protein [Limisphaerales bacterium]